MKREWERDSDRGAKWEEKGVQNIFRRLSYHRQSHHQPFWYELNEP